VSLPVVVVAVSVDLCDNFDAIRQGGIIKFVQAGIDVERVQMKSLHVVEIILAADIDCAGGKVNRGGADNADFDGQVRGIDDTARHRGAETDLPVGGGIVSAGVEGVERIVRG